MFSHEMISLINKLTKQEKESQQLSINISTNTFYNESLQTIRTKSLFLIYFANKKINILQTIAYLIYSGINIKTLLNIVNNELYTNEWFKANELPMKPLNNTKIKIFLFSSCSRSKTIPHCIPKSMNVKLNE